MTVRIQDNELEALDVKAEIKRASNPKAVDDLLAQEMMQLSVKDRNDIQEEIHGVKCLAVEETPTIVRCALIQLAFELDEQTPDCQKKAYLQSQQPPKVLPEHQRIFHELHQLEPLPQSSYVNDVEFRLRFLRCDLFDIKKSAKRILNFLDLALELFGDYALRRPIRLSDFTKEEMRHIRIGRFQVMPNRDRSGRRIYMIIPEQEHTKCPPIIRAKITLYQSWAIGYKDVETQRKGHIVLVWYDKTFISSPTPKLRYRYDASKSTRVSAIHVCSPDTPYFRMRRSISVMRCGDENRSKLRIHLGESVELQYTLQGYGIPTEDIPVSWTGKIKIKNLVQWMRIRHAVENYDDYSPSSMPPGGIVECPQPHDVLFRKGNSYVSHMGNARLRGLITSKACLNEQDRESIKRPKQMANEIIEERLRLSFTTKDAATSGIGKYLIWNNQKDWWNEMTDREQICMKIEYMIRELRRANGKKSRKNQKRGRPTTIKLQSGTTMFRSNDGYINMPSCGNPKKQRLNNAFDSINDTSGSSGDDEDHNTERMTECFGMKFSPCLI